MEILQAFVRKPDDHVRPQVPTEKIRPLLNIVVNPGFHILSQRPLGHRVSSLVGDSSRDVEFEHGEIGVRFLV